MSLRTSINPWGRLSPTNIIPESFSVYLIVSSRVLTAGVVLTDVSSTIYVDKLGTKSENLDIIANNVINSMYFGANFGLEILRLCSKWP